MTHPSQGMVGRLWSVQAGFGPVTAVATAVLPDGRTIGITGGADGTARLWDLTTGQPIGHSLTGHTDRAYAVATTTLNGRPTAITGSRDRTVRLWDLTTGQPIGEPLTGHTGPVYAVATTTLTGQPTAVTGGLDATVRLWNLATGQPIGHPLTGHTGPVNGTATTTLNGQPTAITVSDDGTARIWDLVTGEAIGQPLTGHTGPVYAVATTTLDNRPTAITGGLDATVRLWDLTTGQPIGHPLTDHTSRVRAVATTTLDNRPIAITTSDDGTARLWNLTTGQPIGQPLTGHTSPVWAVAATIVNNQPTAITGGLDATVRLWDLTTGQPIGQPLTGHTDWIHAVATTTLNGQPTAITGSRDRTVRLWNLTTGQPIGQPLTGHTSSVTAVATTTLNGQPTAITGSRDRTVRLWNLTTGQPIGQPLTGHTSSVTAVATTTLNGQPTAITGSDDGTLRVWNLTTGEAIGQPLTGHTDWIHAVATTTLNGQPIAITGGFGGSVRLWDLITGEVIVAVPAHRGPVTCVAVAPQPSGAGPVALTVGEDGLLIAWDVSALAQARAVGVDEIFAAENTGAPDRLSRAGLASHVAERLRLLTIGERSPSPDAGDPSGSGIVHLDGRWGAGKTTLVELLLREQARSLGRPVIVRYDAWRQAAIAPEWWSLAAEVRRAIHGSRAAPTRVVLTLASFARRLGRSTSTWVVLLVVVAAVVVGQWLYAGPGGLSKQTTTILSLITSLSGILAFVFVITRSLFWSAPILGRLHVRTDDNPLGEISGIVGHLRRWSPREGVPQRLLDWALVGWLTVTVSGAFWWKPVVTAWRHLSPTVRSHLIRSGAILAVLAFAYVALRIRRRRSRPERPESARTTVSHWRKRAARLWASGTHFLAWVRRQWIGIGVLAGSGTAIVWMGAPLWSAGWRWWTSTIDPATRHWCLAAAAGVVAYLAILAGTVGRQRRMVLLVIDDLDRCEGDRVVRLLETVHTVLRERSAPRWMRRWREPAPFGVIVCANGRWIRAAFTKHYETFDRAAPNDAVPNDAVHDLGADFLQKIFDHSVLVPGLSPEQTEDLIHVIAGSRYRATAPRVPRRPGAQLQRPTPRDENGGNDPADQELLDRSASEGEIVDPAPRPESAPTSTDGQPLSGSSPQPPVAPAQTARASDIRDAEREARQRQQERAAADSAAARADLGANAQALVTHLLTAYSEILPRNPRLIIRVASAWAMLRAVARSLNLEVDAEPANELLVRAAVIWVRFPLLVDDLFDADRVPIIDPAHPDCPPRWRRNDVQQVLTMNDGRRLDVEDLALYYGKFFPPQVQRTTASQSSARPQQTGEEPSEAR